MFDMSAKTETSFLEIIAKKHLGERALKHRPELRAAFKGIEKSTANATERERIAAIVELCFEYDRESDPDEKENILRTLEEISLNKPIELPRETMDEWHGRLKAKNSAYAAADSAAGKDRAAFLKKYFSLRSKAGLVTQADVARKSGLSRSYIAVIESGDHEPQQKTLQKLAKAFGVDVADMLPNFK